MDDLQMDWPKKQRLRAIEIMTYWHSRLNTGDIINTFGISRIQASKDIKEYISNFPGNIYYSLSDRAYLKEKSFKLHLTKGSLDEYLDHVSRMKKQPHMSIEKISLQHSQLKIDVISDVLNGIRNQKGLSILYASMNRPEGVKRTIFPHSIIDTGFRWHIRAYCENREEFRDFNLGRVLCTPEEVGEAPGYALSINDKMWHAIINVDLCANPSLSANQRRVIELEFDMSKGKLLVRTRACLLHYMLQSYQIDSEFLNTPQSTQLLAVKNPQSINQYLFGAD